MMFPTISIKIERWKFNKEYGIYVSTLGHFKDRYKRNLPIKINSGGYVLIKTETSWKLAHRLVMLTWKPIPNAEELTVDHLDHNKRKNELSNLEWVTREENLSRARNDYMEDNSHKPSAPIVASINNELIEWNANTIWQYLTLNYYPSGYPKDKIKEAMKNMMNGNNPLKRKKLGTKVVLEMIERN